MLKNCFISFISPGIYQCNRTSNRKKGRNLIWTSYILYCYILWEEFICIAPPYIYILFEVQRHKMQMQILWKFLLSNLAIINPETCSNLSRYCFALKICIVFLKYYESKFSSNFSRNYYWENNWIRQVLYLRVDK